MLFFHFALFAANVIAFSILCILLIEKWIDCFVEEERHQAIMLVQNKENLSSQSGQLDV